MGCGTDASDGSGVAVGYKANGVGGVGGVYVISDAVAVGAGDIISGGAGTSVFMCQLVTQKAIGVNDYQSPFLFEDEEWLKASHSGSVVVPVKSSTPTKQKAATKGTSEDFPVHSFGTLITNLSTIAKNQVQPKLAGVSVSFDKLTMPAPLHQRTLDLLKVFSNSSHVLGEGASSIARLMGFLLGCLRSQGGSSARKVETISTFRPLSGKQR